MSKFDILGISVRKSIEKIKNSSIRSSLRVINSVTNWGMIVIIMFFSISYSLKFIFIRAFPLIQMAKATPSSINGKLEDRGGNNIALSDIIKFLIAKGSICSEISSSWIFANFIF